MHAKEGAPCDLLALIEWYKAKAAMRYIDVSRLAVSAWVVVFVSVATSLKPQVTLAREVGQAPNNKLQARSDSYRWKSVQMVGGGFVDGIVFHPTARGVRYARTDMGGAYRWDDRARIWTPILDWVPFADLNFMGVESIALDPHDPNRVYLACGTYTNATTPNGAILRSSDGAKSFQVTRVPFKFGGNENGRGNGERMMVDPNDGRVIFLGTRHDGVWKSNDRGATWSRLQNFPWRPSTNNDGSTRGAGVIAVVFDPMSGSVGKPTPGLYAAVSDSGAPNLFQTKDGGASWNPVSGQPTKWMPTHMILAGAPLPGEAERNAGDGNSRTWRSKPRQAGLEVHSMQPPGDGILYISYGSSPGPSEMRDGAVWKLDTNTSRWTDITPDKPGNGRNFGYAAVAVQADSPQVVIASSFYRPGGEEIFRSIDGGESWKPVFHEGGATYDFSIAPYVARTPIHWLFDIEIDPANPNHALFTTGYGGYETFNLTDVDRGKPTRWSVMSKGIEETVPLELLSPPEGAHLISAIGDYGGFVHWDLDRSPAEGNFDHPHFGNTTGIAYAEAKPSIIVRVGQASGNRGGGNIGYSLDSGRTWQTTAATPQPTSRGGRIAVSADGQTWVWTLRDGAYWTRDKGATWTQCAFRGVGVPARVPVDRASLQQAISPNINRVIADPVNPRKFYALALFDGKLYVSEDGAASFAAHPLDLQGGIPKRGGDRMDNRAGQDQAYATPGREGDLWIAAFDGLHHSADGGKSFVQLPSVEQLHAFGFGKAAPGASFPALYLIGTVDGVHAIFRSDDTGAHWVRINDDRHQWGLLLQIAGDPRVYGRVYVGGHGRGVFYGDVAPASRP